MTSTLEERLLAYRDVLDEAIANRSDEPDAREGQRRWPVLVPVLGVAAAGVLTLGALAVTGRDAAAPTPGAPLATAPQVTTTPTPDTIPATVLEPTTTSAAPATTAGVSGPTVAIGDSAMLGAADELAAAGVVVDVSVSRQMGDSIKLAAAVADRGIETLVVHLGHNGELSDETVDAFFGALSGVPRVVVLTVRAPRGYIPANNAELRALPERYPNVGVVDWEVLAEGCPGDCFYDDSVHLRPVGQSYYAKVILGTLAEG